MAHTFKVESAPNWAQHDIKGGPSGRYGHRAVLYNNRMILHGGYNGKDRLNDTYEYHVDKQQWRLLDQQTSLKPAARDCHSAVLYKNKMIIFGGGDGYTWKNDIWEFDIDKALWSEVKPYSLDSDISHDNARTNSGSSLSKAISRSGISCVQSFFSSHKSEKNPDKNQVQISMIVPSGRAGHSAVVYNNKMIVFGGWNGRRTLNDLYEFNLDTREWSVINPKGNIPQSRDSHTAVIQGHHMYIIGGGDGKQRLNDMHQYDIKNNVWTQLNCMGQVSAGRAGHIAVQYQDKMVIFGGGDGVKWLTDVYECDLRAKKWYMIEAKGKIAPGSYGLSAVAYKNRMIIFGGGDGKSWYNSIYEYICGELKSFTTTKDNMFKTLQKSKFLDIDIRFAADEDDDYSEEGEPQLNSIDYPLFNAPQIVNKCQHKEPTITKSHSSTSSVPTPKSPTNTTPSGDEKPSRRETQCKKKLFARTSSSTDIIIEDLTNVSVDEQKQ